MVGDWDFIKLGTLWQLGWHLVLCYLLCDVVKFLGPETDNKIPQGGQIGRGGRVAHHIAAINEVGLEDGRSYIRTLVGNQ